MSKALENLADAIYKCIRCGSCRAVCPTFREELSELSVARGRLALIEAVMNGRLEMTPAFEKAVFNCALCGACKAGCPSGVDVPAIVEAARAELVNERGSEAALRYMLKHALKDKSATESAMKWMRLGGAIYSPLAATPLRKYLPLQDEMKKRHIPKLPKNSLGKTLPGRTEAPNPKGTVALYAGCVTFYLYPDIGAAATEVLSAAGYNTVFIKDEVCCGKPLKSLGEHDAFAQLSRRNLELFGGLDVEAILTVCPTCALTLKEDYPKIFAGTDKADAAEAMAEKVDDISRFLADDETLASRLNGVQEKVTYHDPCHLNFGMGVKDEPRALINASTGGGLVEMADSTWCCGFGGSFSYLNYVVSSSISDRKAGCIADTGAGTLVTGCPGCIMHITDGLKRAGSDIQALHTVQIIKRALSR